MDGKSHKRPSNSGRALDSSSVPWIWVLYFSSLIAGFALSFTLEVLRMEDGAQTVKIPPLLDNGSLALWFAMLLFSIFSSRKAGLSAGSNQSWMSKGIFFLSLFGFLFSGMTGSIVHRALAAECAAGKGDACLGQAHYVPSAGEKKALILKACGLGSSIACMRLCRLAATAEERSMAEKMVKCD